MADPDAPMVSVCVIAYNHERYIRQCLDGILMQEVDFPYEVLVHDDASTDGTADIIREYEARHQGIVKPIYQSENQYSRGRDVDRFNFDRARGKYLAYCEGDDYWTDSQKLSRQVRFLEANPDFAGTLHRVSAIDGHGERIEIPRYTAVEEHEYTIEEYPKNLIPGQSASYVIRNVFLTMSPQLRDEFYSCKVNGDVILPLLLVLMGKVYCFSEAMATYRYIVSGGKSWSAQTHGENLAYRQFRERLALQRFAREGFNHSLPQSILYDAAITASVAAVSKPSVSNSKILLSIVREMPDKRSMIPYLMVNMPHRAVELLRSRTRQP
ncbi:MAG: glycosyltransferase [Methanomassiliicoccus sp.]|nr:glycosyltransferase [Methanomassiliicoccus sp.]